MNTNLKGRDWLMTQDWSVDELELALDTADQLKADFKAGKPTLHLAHKTAFLIFFDKSTRRIVDVPVEHRGFDVGDEFLLGYGMDWKGRYRNVPSIWAVMDLSVLTVDPDAFQRHASGRHVRDLDGYRLHPRGYHESP